MKLKYSILILFLISYLEASIVNTKHNISTSGTGTIKATSEQEVCAFCHIPHGAQGVGAPLWNRAMPSSTYTMYSSTYLERTNYPRATELFTSPDQPGSVSRLCLSCHDGTIAIGGVYSIRGTAYGTSSPVPVAGTVGDMMPNSSAALIGTDLSKHHPVGYEYGAAMTFAVDIGSRGNELRPTPTAPIKLYSFAGKDYVECSSCHDPHTENKKFLRVGADNSDSHALNVKNTCTSCHNKDGWTNSAHDTHATVYTDATVLSNFGAGTTVGDMGCANCHTPHNGGGTSYLLRKIEQNTCFEGAAGSTATASCHQAGGAKDIETLISASRPYGHGDTMRNTNGVHSNLDYLYGTGVTRDPIGSLGINWSDSQHVECMDCHNQHQAKPGTHAAAGSWYPANNQGTNLISASGALTGASGVRPTTWPSSWTQPQTFTTLETATYEYEICFKCHSQWGLGDDVDNNPESGYPTFSDNTVDFTDVAWEFNVNNRSGHPVTVATGSRAGSLTPKALGTGAMLNPWQAVGTQTMYCSDCHGTDAENGADAKGPHGSSNKFMLKGANTTWPTKANGQHYRVGEAGGLRDWNGVFCQNCHDLIGAGPAHNIKQEMDGLYCVRCHSRIPHGSPISRLLAYVSFPEPYNYQGNMAKLNGIVKRAANSYSRDHASGGSWSPPEAAGNGNCNDKHDNVAPGAESGAPY